MYLGKSPTLSMAASVYSERFFEVFRDKHLLNSGFLTRTLPIVWDGDIPENGLLGEIDPLDCALYEKCITELFECRNNNIVVSMPEDSYRHIDDYRRENIRRANNELRDIYPVVVRFAENAMRLALIFHLANYGQAAAEHEISVETTRDAILLMRFLAGCALKVYENSRAVALTDNDEAILHILNLPSHSRRGAKRHDFRKELASKFNLPEEIDRAIDSALSRGVILNWKGKRGNQDTEIFWSSTHRQARDKFAKEQAKSRQAGPDQSNGNVSASYQSLGTA